jgi:hypothetical protein
MVIIASHSMYALEGVGAAASPLAIRPEDTEPKPEDIPVGAIAAGAIADGVRSKAVDGRSSRRARG